MSLNRIRLELARTPQFPRGSAACGYEFSAPLDSAGRIDSAQWRRVKARCKVRRFWANQGDEIGELLHHRSGRWVFSYRPGDEDDEPLFRLDRHVFQVGEYVSITEHDGITRPFRVTEVDAA